MELKRDSYLRQLISRSWVLGCGAPERAGSDGSLQNRTPAASPSFFNIHPHIFHRISFLHSTTLHLNSMLSPTFLPRKIHPENIKGAMFVGRLLVMSENEVFCVQIFYFVRRWENVSSQILELRINL